MYMHVLMLVTCAVHVDMAVMFIENYVDFSFWLITQLQSTNTDSLGKSKLIKVWHIL